MRWKLRTFSATKAVTLQSDIGLHSIVAGVLCARSIDTPEAARRFINPVLEDAWTDPAAIQNLPEIAQRLELAIKEGKRLCIFGDYDVDGITASAVMYNTFKELGVEATVVLPLRDGEGYGLSEASLERVYELKPDIVLTVDCGISSATEVLSLQERGVEVLITDHHESSGMVPSQVLVADPKLKPGSPQSILAGVGVALKLAALLGKRFGKPELWKTQLDLAALGTIADCMPLIEENRALVTAGLKAMNAKPRASIGAMFRLAGRTESVITAQSLSFGLIPRLNAAGRMSDPLIAFDLLKEEDPEKAERLALKLEELNTERRTIEGLLYEKAIEQMSKSTTARRSIVAGGENWHHGVKGIVASRLAREYGVPALVFSYEDGLAIGSGRSVGTIDLHQALQELSDLMVKFGGHRAAIGATLAVDNMDTFSRRLEELMQEIAPDEFQPAEEVDGIVSLEQLTLEAVDELAVLEPFGSDNPEPVFIAQDLILKSARYVGSDQKHISLLVSDGTRELSAIWFNARCASLEEIPLQADVVFTPKVDEWRGRRKVKLTIKDLITTEQTGSNAKEACAIATGNELEHHLFSRDHGAINGTLASRLQGSGIHLRAAQKKCLETLQAKKSTLGIMATGRGKSLIFHTHATKLALLEKKQSLFIYPLKSLINDQEYFLTHALEPLGLRCASLTGSTPEHSRSQLAKSIKDGSLSVVLSTPEFVMANAHTLDFWDRFAFVVIDEAHHIATSHAGFRPDYTALARLRTLMPKAVFLGLSATSDEKTTEEIVASLAIEQVVVDTSKRPNLLLDDQRECAERLQTLTQIAGESDKSLIYVSSRPRTIELCRNLRKALPDKAHKIAFYHAALTTEDRALVEQAFRDDELTCIVATSAFGEGVNIPHVRDVVLYDMPYSIIDFNQMAGRAGRDGQEAHIHLLACSSDIEQRRSHIAKETVLLEGSVADDEHSATETALKLFSDWLFKESSHGLLSVIQRPLTPLKNVYANEEEVCVPTT